MKNTRSNLANRPCILASVLILAILFLTGCTQGPSMPPATAIAPSATPGLRPAPTATSSALADTEAKIQAVEHGESGSLAERMEYYQVPGVSIAVIDQGVIAWARADGLVEANGIRPVTQDTLFQAASISKPVAAMAALSYVETGLLDLDEDVNHTLTSWKVPENEYTQNSKVTLRGLLSHSAGLTVHGFGGYAEGEEIPTLLQILDGEAPANSAPVRVFVEPGALWQYSGGGYVLLQQLLEDVTGQPFHRLMQEAVLQQLGMQNSTYEQPLSPAWAGLAATGHNGSGEAIRGKWHTYPEMAAAGLWTTPSDLARFIIEIQQSAKGASNRILSTEMTGQMLTAQMDGWGLGLEMGGSGDAAWFAHGGANEGFRCYMIGFTETGQGAVVMTNSDNGYDLAMEIVRTISAVYGWPYAP